MREAAGITRRGKAGQAVSRLPRLIFLAGRAGIGFPSRQFMWTLALVLNVAQLAYHQVMTNFDFFPFNNIRNSKKSQRIGESVFNGLVMAFPIVALLSHTHKMIGDACWVLGFLLIGEFLSWWPHYFLGAPQWMNSWMEVYNRTHKHTIKVLPPIKDHPVPNLEHCILHVISLAAFAATLRYYLSL